MQLRQRYLWVFVFVSATVLNADDEKRAKQFAETNPARSKPELASFFEKEVQPLLKQHCIKCHGDDAKRKANLSLTSREGLLKGGDSGAAVDLKAPADSLLLEAVRYEGYEMPPTGKLADEKIATLDKWIRSGAPWTPGEELAQTKAHEEHKDPTVNETTKKFWSFQPVARPSLPKIDSPWIRSPIDAFVLSNLHQAGLTPSRAADKVALLRRAYYDLTGLPPGPEDIRALLADTSPQAFEKVIDRLLESPQYGVRWGRHWLDLVRYAESNSYERDNAKPNVWRYRDYVIDSFNQDKPYDVFLTEQLAGDELEPLTREGLIATGYYRLGIWDDEPADPKQALYDDLDDILATTSQVFMGLTMNCARCHDHKLDPIPQRDYYRMLAFFSGLNRYGVRGANTVAQFSLRDIGSDEQKREQASQIKAHEVYVSQLRKQVDDIEAIAKKDFAPVEHEEFKHQMNRIPLLRKRIGGVLTKAQFAEYQRLTKEVKKAGRFKPKSMDQALCVTEIGRQPRDTFVLIRGNPHAQGDAVQPGFPEVLGFDDPSISDPAEGVKTSGRRTALARWLASDKNPLTARVMANRIWQHHFGRGIVGSTSNFGLTGDAPTHPQLLDWLAAELMDGGWRLKRIHKLIMLSNAYQMSSRGRSEAFSKDPENKHLWRYLPRRLAAEEIRDSILAVNGTLNLKLGGPSIYAVIPKEVLAGQSRPGNGWGQSPPEERARRSVFIHLKRSLMTPILAVHDAADPDFTCPERFASTQPTQALLMLNSDFINEQARTFAANLKKTCDDDVKAQVTTGLARVMQRRPTKAEVERGLTMINSLQREDGLSPEKALEYFCLMALNLNEFVYLD